MVFWREGKLWAVRFDPDLLEVSGTPVVVMQEVGADRMGDAWFSLSGEGTLSPTWPYSRLIVRLLDRCQVRALTVQVGDRATRLSSL